MDVLKLDVKFIHTFVIVFNGESPRMTLSLKSMIRLFEKMFGILFWENVLLGVSRWSYDPRSIRNRVISGEDEAEWQRQWNNKLHQQYDIKAQNDIEAIFIDTFHDPSNPYEREQFLNNAKKLWDFANSVKPFECKDIKTALTELMEANVALADLEGKLRDAETRLEDIKSGISLSMCLNTMF